MNNMKETITEAINTCNDLITANRTGILRSVDEYMNVGAAAQPINTIMDLLNKCTDAYGYIEQLARNPNCKAAMSDHDQYLPTYSGMADSIYVIKELIVFLTEIETRNQAILHNERQIKKMRDIAEEPPCKF